MEFFSSRRKVTSKWTASYASDSQQVKKLRVAGSSDGLTDKGNFDGKL